jgi:hypothetical protein
MLTAALPGNPTQPPLMQRQPHVAIDTDGRTDDGSSDGDLQDEYAGSYMGHKTATLLRVAALNVGRFPIDPQAPKMTDFFGHVRRIRLDVLAFSEFGLNPLAMSRHQQWSERTRGQFETLKSRIAFNEHVRGTEPTLWGGTGIMCLDRMAARVFETGQDPTGLGRWTWMRL